VFFHASEVQPADADATAPAAAAAPQPGGAEALQALQQGDEVAFTAYPPPAPGAKWAARQARHGWSPHLRTQDCARAPLRIALRGCKASALRQQAALCSSTVHHAVHPPSEEVHGLCQRGRRARAPRRPSPPAPPRPAAWQHRSATHEAGAAQVKRLPKGTLEAAAGPQEGVRMRGVVQRELRGGSSQSAQWGVKARARPPQ